MPGQLVMYWTKRQKPNRAETGRWFGPAKVVLQEGTSIVWISHADRLLRCAPENLRPASLREWNNYSLNNITSIAYDSPPFNATPNLEPPESPEDMYEPSIAPDPPQPTSNNSEQPEQEASPPASQPSDQAGSETETLETDLETPETGDADLTDDALLLQVTELPELALDTKLERSDKETSLFSFDLLHHASEEHQVCLAEDGLPYFEEPLECSTEE